MTPFFCSPSRVCKERSDGIAIARTFQSHLLSQNHKSAIASPTTRRRRKPAMGKKKDTTQCDVIFFGFLIRNSYTSKFQNIGILPMPLIRYISSIVPKGLISPQFWTPRCFQYCLKHNPPLRVANKL
mgnify:CR=1 FL=1